MEKFCFRFRIKIWNRIQTIFSTALKKIVQFSLRNSIVSVKVGLSFLNFFTVFTFVFLFVLDPDPNPVPESKCISVPVPLRQKVADPVPQLTIVTSLFSSFLVFSVCSFFCAQF